MSARYVTKGNLNEYEKRHAEMKSFAKEVILRNGSTNVIKVVVAQIIWRHTKLSKSKTSICNPISFFCQVKLKSAIICLQFQKDAHLFTKTGLRDATYSFIQRYDFGKEVRWFLSGFDMFLAKGWNE